jgi:nicotinamide-nucleotide amidase
LTDGPRAVVVITGSELVRGDRRDANGPFLAAELSRLGMEPSRWIVVGDRGDDLAGALRGALEADLCVVSGGLGPTHDDRTAEVLAQVTGRQLVVDPDLEGQIEAFSRGIAERLGRPYADFYAGVRKQASLPDGATCLGLAGTAPAFLVEHDGRVAIVLPGPPPELRRLWPSALAHPAVQAVLARAHIPRRRVLRFFGPSESAVARTLDEAGGEGDGVQATVCARDLEIHVDLTVEVEGERRAATLEAALSSAFPGELFATDDDRPVEELVLEACRAAGLTLGTAESCTGGLVGARLTDVPGASDVYVGGVIAYSDDIKRTELDVPDDVLRSHGAVSAEIAQAMAAGARRRLGSDLAVADTGIAGPGGATLEKPVGLVYIAVQGPETVSTERFVFPGDREAVRARATAMSLHAVRRLLAQSASHSSADGA